MIGKIGALNSITTRYMYPVQRIAPVNLDNENPEPFEIKDPVGENEDIGSKSGKGTFENFNIVDPVSSRNSGRQYWKNLKETQDKSLQKDSSQEENKPKNIFDNIEDSVTFSQEAMEQYLPSQKSQFNPQMFNLMRNNSGENSKNPENQKGNTQDSSNKNDAEDTGTENLGFLKRNDTGNIISLLKGMGENIGAPTPPEYSMKANGTENRSPLANQLEMLSMKTAGRSW